MKQGQIVFRFLFPPRQYAAKTVHPAMRPLDNPTTGLEAGFSFNRLCFFATRTNMSCVAKLFDQISYLARIITLVQAHTLRLLLFRFRPFYRNTLYGCLYHFAVVPICSLNCQANRHTRCFGQQTSFNTFFGPICGIRAGFFPRRVGLLSWRHPSTARTSQSLSTRHSLPELSPRVSEKLRPLSTLETVSGLCCSNKYQFRSERSTDSRFAAQKELRPWPCDPALSACRRRNDVCSDALAAAVRFFPIIRLKSCICSLFFVLSSLNPFKGTIAFKHIGNSGVIRIGS